MSSGATDGAFLRNAGIPTYGHSGMAMELGDSARLHGKDERVPVKSFYQGNEYLYRELADKNVSTLNTLRPKLIEMCVVAALLTVVAWASWSPSGEAGPGEKSIDWRAAGGVVLAGFIPVTLWGLAAFSAERVRVEHNSRA